MPPTPRLALWVHSAPEGRKAELFNREPRVAIEMDIEERRDRRPLCQPIPMRIAASWVRVPFIESKAPKQNVTGSPESCIIWPREASAGFSTKRWPAQTSTAST